MQLNHLYYLMEGSPVSLTVEIKIIDCKSILRTSRYASCVGKMNDIPVIRVNGENPDEVMRAAMVAMSYRNMWQKDVIVDMLCYRR